MAKEQDHGVDLVQHHDLVEQDQHHDLGVICPDNSSYPHTFDFNAPFYGCDTMNCSPKYLEFLPDATSLRINQRNKTRQMTLRDYLECHSESIWAPSLVNALSCSWPGPEPSGVAFSLADAHQQGQVQAWSQQGTLRKSRGFGTTQVEIKWALIF